MVEEARVPHLRVNLLRTASIPPRQVTIVEVKVGEELPDLLLLDGDHRVEEDPTLQVEDAILSPDGLGVARVSLWNSSGFTQIAY